MFGDYNHGVEIMAGVLVRPLTPLSIFERMFMMANMVRVNTRISNKANDWLDKESKSTGVPKSTLIYLALETYISQQQTILAFSEMSEKLTTIAEKVSSL